MVEPETNSFLVELALRHRGAFPIAGKLLHLLMHGNSGLRRQR